MPQAILLRYCQDIVRERAHRRVALLYHPPPLPGGGGDEELHGRCICVLSRTRVPQAILLRYCQDIVRERAHRRVALLYHPPPLPGGGGDEELHGRCICVLSRARVTQAILLRYCQGAIVRERAHRRVALLCHPLPLPGGGGDGELHGRCICVLSRARVTQAILLRYCQGAIVRERAHRRVREFSVPADARRLKKIRP